MDSYQQLFAVFYAVSYGAMLNAASTLKPFPWGFRAALTDLSRKQLGHRVWLSLLLLNLAPFLVFGSVVMHLPRGHCLTWWPTLWTACASLTVYFPYRLYHLALAVRPQRFYSDSDWEEVMRTRHFRSDPSGHAIAAVFYAITFLPACAYAHGWPRAVASGITRVLEAAVAWM